MHYYVVVIWPLSCFSQRPSRCHFYSTGSTGDLVVFYSSWVSLQFCNDLKVVEKYSKFLLNRSSNTTSTCSKSSSLWSYFLLLNYWHVGSIEMHMFQVVLNQTTIVTVSCFFWNVARIVNVSQNYKYSTWVTVNVLFICMYIIPLGLSRVITDTLVKYFFQVCTKKLGSWFSWAWTMLVKQHSYTC